MRGLAWLAVCGVAAGCAVPAPGLLVSYRVTGDAIVAPLTAEAGDPARGRKVFEGRDGNCFLCHTIPGGRFMGNLASPLAGVGARLNEGQLRLRIVDSMRLNRATIMPSYYRIDGLNQVAPAWRGKPLLTEQEIEDTVAYLLTLR